MTLNTPTRFVERLMPKPAAGLAPDEFLAV